MKTKIEQIEIDGREYREAETDYTVIVGNIGMVYDGTCKEEALRDYHHYVDLSKLGIGRAGGEPVAMFVDNELDPGYDYQPEGVYQD